MSWEFSLGDLCGGGTPGPIPNPEVKPASADGTWLVTARESRSSPRDFLIVLLAGAGCDLPAMTITIILSDSGPDFNLDNVSILRPIPNQSCAAGNR